MLSRKSEDCTVHAIFHALSVFRFRIAFLPQMNVSPAYSSDRVIPLPLVLGMSCLCRCCLAHEQCSDRCPDFCCLSEAKSVHESHVILEHAMMYQWVPCTYSFTKPYFLLCSWTLCYPIVKQCLREEFLDFQRVNYVQQLYEYVCS